MGFFFLGKPKKCKNPSLNFLCVKFLKKKKKEALFLTPWESGGGGFPRKGVYSKKFFLKKTQHFWGGGKVLKDKRKENAPNQTLIGPFFPKKKFSEREKKKRPRDENNF